MAATNNLLAPDQLPNSQQHQRRKSTLSGNGFFIDYSCTRRRSSAAMQARGQVDLRHNSILRAQVSPVRWARNQSISCGGGGGGNSAAPTSSQPTSPSSRGQQVTGSAGSGNNNNNSNNNYNYNSKLSRASYSAAYLPRGSFLAPAEAAQRKASIFEPSTGVHSSTAAVMSPHLLAAQRRKSTMVTGGAVLLPPPPRVVEHMTSALSAAARGSSAGASRFKRELAQQVPVIGCSPTSIRASLAALDETRRCEKMLRQLRRRQHRKEKRQRKREKRLAKGLPPEPPSDEDDDRDEEYERRQRQEAGDEGAYESGDNLPRRALSLRRKSVRAIKGAAELLRRPGRRRRARSDLMSVSSIDLASSRSSLGSSLEQQFRWQRSEEQLDPDELYLDDNTLANFDEPSPAAGSAAATTCGAKSLGGDAAGRGRGDKRSLVRSALRKLTSTISGKPSNQQHQQQQQQLQQQRLSRASRALSIGTAGPSLSYLYYYYYLCEDSLDEIDDLPLGASGLVLSQAERRAQLHMNYSLARIKILNLNSKQPLPLNRLVSQETQSDDDGEGQTSEEQEVAAYDFGGSTDISLALSSETCSTGSNSTELAEAAEVGGCEVARSSSSESLCPSSRLAASNSVCNSDAAASSTSASPSRLSTSTCSASHRQLQVETGGGGGGGGRVAASGACLSSMASSSVEEDYASVDLSQQDQHTNGQIRHRLAPGQTRSHSPVPKHQQHQQKVRASPSRQICGQSLSTSPSWNTAPLQVLQSQSPSRASSHRHLSPSQVQVEEPPNGRRSASFADSVSVNEQSFNDDGDDDQDDEQELDDFERFNRCYKPSARVAAESTHFDRRFSKLRLSLKSARNQPTHLEPALRSAQTRTASMSWDTLSGGFQEQQAQVHSQHPQQQQQQQQQQHSSHRTRLTSGKWRRESSGHSTRTSSAASGAQVVALSCSYAPEAASGRSADCKQCRLDSRRGTAAMNVEPPEEADLERERARSHSSILHLGLDDRPLPVARLEEPRGDWPQRAGVASAAGQRRCTSASLRVPRRNRRQVDAERSCQLGLAGSAGAAASSQQRTMRNQAVMSTSTTLLHCDDQTSSDLAQLRVRALSTGTGSGLKATANRLRSESYAPVPAQRTNSNQQQEQAAPNVAETPSSQQQQPVYEQLDVLALLRKNSFTCMLLGAHQVGKRTIVKCFVKLLNEFRQAVDEYRKERMLSRLMDCSERLQGLAAASSEQAAAASSTSPPPERSRLNSWLPSGGAMNRLLHLPGGGSGCGNKRRMNSMVAAASASCSMAQPTPPEQRRHTTMLEPVSLELTQASGAIQTGSNFNNSANGNSHNFTFCQSTRNNNASSNYLSVAGSSAGGQQCATPGSLLGSVCNKSDHDISYSCSYTTNAELEAQDTISGGGDDDDDDDERISDFQLQVPSQLTSSPSRSAHLRQGTSSRDTAAGLSCSSARRSTQLLSPTSPNIRLTCTFGSAEPLNGAAASGARQSRVLSMQPNNVVASAKPPLLSLRKLNKRRIKVRFKTRRQLSERYLTTSQHSSPQTSESNLQADTAVSQRQQQQQQQQKQQQHQDKTRQQTAEIPDSFMIVYAVNDRESFEYAKTLIGKVRSIKQEAPLPIVIVANKIDLERAKVVKSEEGRILAKRNACKYIEVSCTIGHNLDNLLVGLRTQFILKHHTILNSVLRHGKTNKSLNETKANKTLQQQRQPPAHKSNALVRFYKRYVVDNGELNYDCDNFSKL